jgi:hypothetical protein
MTASDDELRAHLLVIADHAREALELLGMTATPGSLIVPPGTPCTHPIAQRTYAMGGYWICSCGANGKDADE